MKKQEEINEFVQQLVLEHTDYLFQYAKLKLKNDDDIKDLIQETFISALKNIDQFQNKSSIRTWLTSILKNKIFDHLKKKSTLNIDDYLSSTENQFNQLYFDSNNYNRWQEKILPNQFIESESSHIENKEFSEALYHCIQHLPEKIKPIFVSKYLDEEKSEVICKEFNISQSNYWVIIFRCKTYLRNCLEKKYSFKP